MIGANQRSLPSELTMRGTAFRMNELAMMMCDRFFRNPERRLIRTMSLPPQ